MKLAIKLGSIILASANLVLAVSALWLHADSLRPLTTVVGSVNTLGVAVLGIWGLRKAVARERLADSLEEVSKALRRNEVEVLFLLHRFMGEHQLGRPYELGPEFVEDGPFHKTLGVLRTARLVVSLHRSEVDGERVERGRFRVGDQVDVTPIGLILCDEKIVESLALTTRDGSKWPELYRSIWGKQLDVSSELSQRASAV